MQVLFCDIVKHFFMSGGMVVESKNEGKNENNNVRWSAARGSGLTNFRVWAKYWVEKYCCCDSACY